MDIILTIRDGDFGSLFITNAPLKERRASRAVIFDKDKNIALLHATKKHFHKLPGGGIEEGESIEQALRRELVEEIGCAAENIRELGIIEEFRNKSSLHQISYCFVADLSGEKGVPHLEPDEVEAGFETVWMTIAEAIKTVETEALIEDYEGHFMQKRELAILKLAAESDSR